MSSVSEKNDQLEKPSVARIETKTGRKLRLSAEAKASYARANQLDCVGRDGERGTVVVKATKNNTFLTFHDRRGEVVYCTSAGQLRFPASERGSLFAAQAVGEACAEWLLSDQDRIHASRFGRTVFYKFHGDGPGCVGAWHGLRAGGVEVLLRDWTSP